MNSSLEATHIATTWIAQGKITPERIHDLVAQITSAIHAENEACALLAEACHCKAIGEAIRKRRKNDRRLD